MTYPADWPRCPFCNAPALADHLTCGKATCPESTARSLRNLELMKEAFTKAFKEENGI